MKKFISILIPIILIGASILVMIGGNYLKKPRGEFDNIPKFFETVKSEVADEKWDNVLQTIEAAEKAFNKVRKRIQFSVERDEVNRIGDNLARIKGYAAAKNKAGALAEIAEASNHWNELGK